MVYPLFRKGDVIATHTLPNPQLDDLSYRHDIIPAMLMTFLTGKVYTWGIIYSKF
jgi:hypothetical protein